jgi:hypothetical protein
MVFSNIELKSFQIKFILELFMCLMLELLKLFFLNSLKITFFLSNLWSQSFGNFFVVYIFLWICTIFSILFPTRIAKLGKFENKNMLVVGKWKGCGAGEGREGVNPTIQTQNFTKSYCFYFYKGNKCKIYSYIIKK